MTKSTEEDLYVLTLTRRQAQIIQRALDLYFRLGLGQVQYVVCTIVSQAKFDVNIDKHINGRDLLDRAKQLLTGYGPGWSRGISSPHLPMIFKEACDIHDVIRHRISWDISQEGGIGVNFHEPFKHSDKPFPMVERKE